jgi:flagellar basal-body rod modification protein FlgD
MNINAADPPGLANLANSASAGKPLAAGQLKEADHNTFLTLLIAQLKNQDPLAPQDGAQFVAQLAQFNSLEQLISINQRLGQLVSQTQTVTDQTGSRQD